MKWPDRKELAHHLEVVDELVTLVERGQIVEAIRRARIPSTIDGYPTSTIGAGSPNAETITAPERAAMSAQRDDGVTDQVRRACDALRRGVAEIAVAVDGFVVALDQAEARRGRQVAVIECAEIHCAELVPTGSPRGRCQPCRDWQAEVGDPLRPVPSHVVEARSERVA